MATVDLLMEDSRKAESTTESWTKKFSAFSTISSSEITMENGTVAAFPDPEGNVPRDSKWIKSLGLTAVPFSVDILKWHTHVIWLNC